MPTPKKDDLALSTLAGHLNLRNQTLREDVATKILTLFRISVIVTGVLTIALAAVDAVMICNHIITPDQRLVTERVLLALIGASIVELGAGLTAIVLALFPKQQMTSEDSGGSPPPEHL